MSSASIADLSASDSGYEAQSSDVFSSSTSASTLRTIAVKQEDRSSTFSISDYLFYPSSPIADQTLGASHATTPTADTTVDNNSLFTPPRGSSHDEDDSFSSPYPVYSTPPSAKRTAASPSVIFSPSKVPTPTAVVPLHVDSSPLFSSPIKAEQPEPSPLRRSAAPSPDSVRASRPQVPRRQTTPWAMATIEEDEVLEDFFLPGIHLDVDINEDPGFSSDTCEALTTYLNLPDDDDMLDMLTSIATYPAEAQDAAAPAANLVSDTESKPAFSVRGWGDTDELCARSGSSPRRFSPYKRPATKGKSGKSCEAGSETDDLALFTSCSLGNALGLFTDCLPAPAAPAPIQNPAMVIPSANSWTRYTNNARDDPSWLAHPLRDDKLQPSLKRKTARISRTLSIAEKENHEDVVMTSTPDGACEKQSLQSSGLAEASVLPWQGAPIVVGYAVWAGADPMAYATPLPYFNGCTGADRTLMHGVNELSVLRGAAREAAHTISGVFELESAGAPAQLAAVDEALPPWRMVEASFWLD